MKRSIDLSRWLVLWLLPLLATTADASVIGVSANPAQYNVVITANGANIPVVWAVIRENFNCLPTVTSPSGEFRAGGRNGVVLGTVSVPLSRTQPDCGGNFPTTLMIFNENLTVPQSVLAAARDLGFNQIMYTRIFDDCCGASAGDVIINITSASAAGFSITRIALMFDDEAPVRIVERREALQALAEISFNGSGLARGMWEIAGPTSTSGEPVFRPLAAFNQHLLGTDAVRVRSPVLPTDNVGLYLLRLRVTDPATTFETPVIRYFVRGKDAAVGLPPQPIALNTPPARALLARDTAFAWAPIRGARAYQLEVYAAPRSAADALPDLGGDTVPRTLPKEPPVTGMLVPGTRTRIALSDIARSHLVSGRTYLWRVLAIGNDGGIIGESPVRELRMP